MRGEGLVLGKDTRQCEGHSRDMLHDGLVKDSYKGAKEKEEERKSGSGTGGLKNGNENDGVAVGKLEPMESRDKRASTGGLDD
ncbi:hypothetical protein VNO78_16274 [Psophocarpus tetragonolobus]|uniref:Uncharacterized protein n=1 Tax=Psophocarpus tetragonolobus TaxID=3891 RepID=A0AAN9SGI9_PSOTE